LNDGLQTVARRSGAWRWFALLAGGLALFYLDALRTGFLNDDYLFLEQAKRASLAHAITHPDPLVNYFRPLSRQIYFAVLTPVAGDRPLVFHLFNFAIFLGSLALIADLLLALLPLPAVLAGTLYFALIPFQRVNLTWVSCSQDLLAGLLGVQRPSLTHAVAELEAAGLILRGRRQITILDRPGLIKASCECYQLVRERVASHLPQSYVEGGVILPRPK